MPRESTQDAEIPGVLTPSSMNFPPIALRRTRGEVNPMKFQEASLKWLGLYAIVFVSGCGGGTGTAAVNTGGGSGGTSGAAIFAEATPSGVRLTWDSSTFQNAGTPVSYQIYRSDAPGGADVPVIVLTDTTTKQVVDGTTGNPTGVQYSNLNSSSANSTCISEYGNVKANGPIPGVELGRPYTYRIAQVFDIQTKTKQCYYQDGGISSQTVTPLASPILTAPVAGTKLSGPTSFTAQGVAGNYSITLEYVLQFSTNSKFPNDASETYTFQPLQQTGKGASIVTFTADPNATFLPANILNATAVYWRIGAKNIADAPGPAANGGLHYIFSSASTFSR